MFSFAMPLAHDGGSACALDGVIQALGAVVAGQNVLTPEQQVQAHLLKGSGESLTQREIEILRLLSRGRETLAMADELTISATTIRTHVQNIFTKLGAHSKLEAVTIARDRGLI